MQTNTRALALTTHHIRSGVLPTKMYYHKNEIYERSGRSVGRWPRSAINERQRKKKKRADGRSERQNVVFVRK